MKDVKSSLKAVISLFIVGASPISPACDGHVITQLSRGNIRSEGRFTLLGNGR